MARSVASAALLIATLTCLPFAVAQMDLEAAIRDISGWPCADHTWAACPEVVAPGGLEPGPWYELTTWREGDYDVSNADGSGTTYVGEEARVRDVRQLYDALEDRRVARVVVTDPLTFDGDDVPWPTAGIPHPTRCHHRGGSGVRRHPPELRRRLHRQPHAPRQPLRRHQRRQPRLRGVRLLDAGGDSAASSSSRLAARRPSPTCASRAASTAARPPPPPAAAGVAPSSIVNADRPLTPAELAAAAPPSPAPQP